MNIPMVKVPTFTTELPLSKQEVKYRPYVVKEEKLLIMANESNDVDTILNAVGDIVSNCTFGAIDIKTAPMVDVQHIFLKIRGKSLGELYDFNCICQQCKAKNPKQVSGDDFKVKNIQGHTHIIDLEEGYRVVMKYPTFYDFMKLYMTSEEDEVYSVIAGCIDRLHTEEETFVNSPETSKDFLDLIQNMTVGQFEKIETFFTTMPRLQNIVEYTCGSCKSKNTLIIEGISNFFA